MPEAENSHTVSHQTGQPVSHAAAVDSAVTDTVVTDTVAADSAKAVIYGLEIRPAAEEPEPVMLEPDTVPGTGMSWIVVAISAVFLAVAVKYRTNTRYINVLFREMFAVRRRGNVFDDTVRETSFLLLLNLLWSVCGGILLAAAVGSLTAAGAGICMGIVALYTMLMALAYYTCGSIFRDAQTAAMWVRGYAAGQGGGSIVLLPLSLLQLCYPELTQIWVGGAAVTLILVKMVFIWKGFRIFFTQSAHWLLFLYYLCSLEIVPLIPAYLAAARACETLL